MAYLAFLHEFRNLAGDGMESGALTNIYRKGTTTRDSAYSDSGLMTETTNPYVADSGGRTAFYIHDTREYTLRSYTADGATKLLEIDVSGGVFSAVFIHSSQMELFSIEQTATAGQTEFTLSGVQAGSVYHVEVFVDGLRLPRTYTVTDIGSDTRVILPSGVAEGSKVLFDGGVFQGLKGDDGDFADTDNYTTLSGGDGTELLAVRDSGANRKVAINSLPVTATGGSTARTLAARFGSEGGWDVRDFGHANTSGVVEEATFGLTGTIASGDPTFTDSSASFSSADLGKYIVLHRVGTDLPSHAATIASINSSTSIELSSAPAWSLTGNCSYWYGKDNAPAFNAAITAARALGGGVIRARGYFGVASTVYLKSGVFLDLDMMPAFREGVDYLESTHWKGTRGRIISLAAMNATIECDYTGISDAATGDVMGVLRGTVDANMIATNAFKADRSLISGIAGSAVHARDAYFRGALEDGAYLLNQSGLRMNDCATSENKRYGMYVTGTDMKITNPEAQLNGDSGIMVGNGGEFNTIIGGKLEDNRNYGLEIFTATGSTCLWQVVGTMFQNNDNSHVWHGKSSGATKAILNLIGCQFGNGGKNNGASSDVDVEAAGSQAYIYLSGCSHIGTDVEYLYRADAGVIRSLMPSVTEEPTVARALTSSGGVVDIIDAATAAQVRAKTATAPYLTPANLADLACFKATKGGTAQTGVSCGSIVKVTFGTQDHDRGGDNYSTANSRWTPPAGVVEIAATAYLYAAASGRDALLTVLKNGSRFCDGPPVYTGTTTVGLSVLATDTANGTDYYEIGSFVSGAGTYTIDGNTYATRFSGKQI